VAHRELPASTGRGNLIYYDTQRHLVADTLQELHTFAAEVGIKRCWFDGGDHPHYDIPLYLRSAVEDSRAKLVSSRKILEVSKLLCRSHS